MGLLQAHFPPHDEQLHQKTPCKVQPPRPQKPQLLPHKHHKINYGAKTQYTPNVDNSTKLDEKSIKRVQGSVGDMLHYERAVNTNSSSALEKSDPNKRG